MPREREDTAAIMDNDVCLNNLPTDALVEILLRLHTSKRWRLRLVCRRWRDVIEDRTPAPSRPVPLAFVASYAAGIVTHVSAYIVEDLSDGRCKEIWRSNNPHPTRNHRVHKSMVGTCNGVLCLCDNTVPGGAISLLNPVTGETLAVPPLPGSAQWRQYGMTKHKAYSFGYDTTTERYTVVHVPCYFDNSAGFNFVQMFTFTTGASPAVASWHDVPVPGGTCCLNAGIISIDGAMYWITMGMESVVSLDLREERVAFTMALPKRQLSGYTWHLAEVHGRLGLVSSAVDDRRTPEKIEAWVLGGGRQWSREYNVEVKGVIERIARPHFAHGDHVLLTGNKQVVYGHKLRNAARRLQSGEVRSVKINEKIMPDVVVSGMSGELTGIFSYVKNTEPF